MTAIDWTNPDNYCLSETDQTAALDLAAEAQKAQEQGEPHTLYRVEILRDDGTRDSAAGTMLWFPEACRAGIAWGADASWTDANTPEEAIRRFATDDMRE